MEKNVQRTLIILLAVIALVIGALVSKVVRMQAAPLTPEQLQTLGVFVRDTPREIKDFELIVHHGQAFDASSLEGQWSFIFFGFTYCPDVCPTTMALLKQLRDSWEGSEFADQTQYLLVTVDPERDTPEQLGKYVGHFDQEFVGVTGKLETL